MTHEEFSNKFMSHLNIQQKEAAQTFEGAILLLAVPGSGKTTVLVTRLGYMVYCSNIDPGSILTMTYTVAATKEMQQRFASVFGDEYADTLEFRTINGLSAKIIEYYSRNHGKRQPFDLLENDGEQARIVGHIYQNISNEYATESTIKDIRTAITYIKNMMLTKEEIDSLDLGIAQLPEIYNQYCAELRQRGLMDYDDQMIYAKKILETYSEVLEYFQEKYRYICVDESQDTSKIQHAIIRLLAQKYGNIFMVGDEDQSIYGFRAAYPEALIDFSSDYPNAKVLLIEYNYRSTREIVDVANKFVSRNRFRHQKYILPTRGNGLPIQVIDAMNRPAQYKYLFALAQNCEKETAVLFRNNDSTLPLIDMFERNGISYNCRPFDGTFFTHRIVADITDIINFAYNQHDEETFMRVYYKFGCPLTRKAATYACEQSRKTGKSILDELIKFPELGKYAKDGVQELLTVFPMITKSNATKAVQLIWDIAGYGKYAESNKLDSGKVAILCMLGENEPSPRDLINRLKELRDITQNPQNSNSNKLLLSTIHSSKGLEYDRVFLLDILDGILPLKRITDASSQDEIKQYEEDRRLFYVGITRARNELYIFNCQDTKSAFTSEVLDFIPDEVIDPDTVMAIFKQVLIGKNYMHKSYGKGTVIAQCGFSVLVEYEKNKFQLLTIPQLFEQRDTTVIYETVTESRHPERQGHIHKTEKDLSAKEKERLFSLVTAGRDVTHRKYGKGIISKVEGSYVTIRFDRDNEDRKFDLDITIRNGLIEL